MNATAGKKLKSQVIQSVNAAELTKGLNQFLSELDAEVVSVQMAADAGCLAALVLYTEVESPNKEPASI